MDDCVLPAQAIHDLTRFEFWSLLIGGLGFLGLLVYIIVTTRLWFEAKEANRQASEHHELGKRAWLLASDLSSAPLVAGGNQIFFTVKHIGGVPATKILASWGFGVSVDQPRKWEWKGSDAYGAIAGSTKLTPTIELLIKEPMLRQIESEQIGMWIICRIDYADYFAARKPTIACWKYNPKHLRWSLISHDIDQEDVPGAIEDDLV